MHVMLCYVMLCYVMLCYVMLCYVTIRYVTLCYFMHDDNTICVADIMFFLIDSLFSININGPYTPNKYEYNKYKTDMNISLQTAKPVSYENTPVIVLGNGTDGCYCYCCYYYYHSCCYCYCYCFVVCDRSAYSKYRFYNRDFYHHYHVGRREGTVRVV